MKLRKDKWGAGHEYRLVCSDGLVKDESQAFVLLNGCKVEFDLTEDEKEQVRDIVSKGLARALGTIVERTLNSEETAS